MKLSERCPVFGSRTTTSDTSRTLLGVVEHSGLVAWSVANAEACAARGDYGAADEWLQAIAVRARPKKLLAQCLDWRSKRAAAHGDWTAAERLASEAHATDPEPSRQERVHLLRRRVPMMSDHDWQVMSAKIPRPKRLPVGLLFPDVQHVCACGAYFAWGRHSDAPWSRYLRLGKGWAADEEERSAVFSLAGAYIARYIATETSILEHAAVVVPVPANPDRFATRMVSLTDELAASVHKRLCMPAYLRAIAWEPDHSAVEMKKLSRRERAQLAPHLFRPGPQAGKVRGLCVLLVDDLITSGSTMRACARVLLAQGATSVLGAALAHTEG